MEEVGGVKEAEEGVGEIGMVSLGWVHTVKGDALKGPDLLCGEFKGKGR